MNTSSQQNVQVKLEIQPPAGQKAQPVTITGVASEIHSDPKKIHQLLDLLDMPKGTEVKVLTTASTSIVR